MAFIPTALASSRFINPLVQFAGPLPDLPPTDQPADGQRDRCSEMAEGDPHLQEQVPAQEQGAEA